MRVAKSLHQAVKLTLDFKKKPVNDIAAELGVSENLVYRWSQSEDSVGFADIPIKRLLSIMNTTNCDAILDYLEARRGRVAVRVPKVLASKRNENEMVSEYQTLTITAIKALKDFLNKPNCENYHKIDGALKVVMQETASINKYAKKKVSGQFEFDYD